MKFHLIIFTIGLIIYQTQARIILADYDETGRKLPPGVPRQVDTNGQVLFIDSSFTTKAYQQAALDSILREANQVAKEMQLPESSPITRSNLAGGFISPFGFAYAHKAIGSVYTTNYHYGVNRGNKFSDLTIANYDTYYVEYQDKKYQLPINQLDTNAAYQLAKQWLTAAHMDVKTLEKDCFVHVELSADMSGEARRKSKFAPVYFVWWTPKTLTGDTDSRAYVELYLPEKKLLQMTVYDPQYILRPPLVFTNLAEFFPGKATITTNYPVPIKVLDARSLWSSH